MTLMSDISYYRTENKGDKNMLQETEPTEIRHHKDIIREEVNAKLELLGVHYRDEVTRYLLTGESTIQNQSEKRLILDIQYLLTKVSILEDIAFDLMQQKENTEYLRSHPQTTIDDCYNKSIWKRGSK